MQPAENTLKRTLSLPLVTFFGLGNILGAGIYVLIGKVAGEAGYLAPLAFFIASIVAAISAFTYAELSARYPVSAGEAVYIQEGFHNVNLSRIVGLLIMLAGIVSSAAIAHGFAGYLQVFIDIPAPVIVVTLIVSLGALAAWGINESTKVAALLTIIEVAGLILIMVVGADYLTQRSGALSVEIQSTESVSWTGVFSGAFLAFYAYIGFEDMVNIAEEVKEPQRNMPRAILICVVVSSLLYAAISWVAVNVLTQEQLTSSTAPLALLYTEATGEPPVLITVIGLFAVVNGCLIQIIMASRLSYGMASRNWLPAPLATIHPATSTPINSTLGVVILILLFALAFPLVTLAQFTSYLVLTVFALVNLALLRIKVRLPNPGNVAVYSVWLPRFGFATTAMFLMIEIYSKVSQ
ncbi:MAG: amino acid permease [bacterium]|nr:amino acid permease [Gammaproteobacteria bacterium]HIL96137.1 amino acid permease [Pseudomonadales bacterium]